MKSFTYLLLISLLCFTACGQEKSHAASDTTANSAAPRLDGYELTAIPGINAQEAVKRNAAGKVIEIGTVENGQRQGSWTTYSTTGYAPVKIEHYLNGQLHGAYLEMDNVGRLLKSANYQLNKLHGPYAELRASIPQVTATYKEGKLHETYRLHTLQNGKVNRTMEYQDGELEGSMRWYNDAGELMQEKFYRHGEIVN
jgi:antitoxin component YwqK of YwqJK toxin-antitoxin module